MHERLNQIGASFANLASNLLPSREQLERMASPQPQADNRAEDSGLGVIGRFFDRVVKTN